jgi:hypothetical protein
MEKRLPPGFHSMIGPAGGTLGLETGLFTFYTRRQLWLGAVTNLDADTRFRPEFAVAVNRVHVVSEDSAEDRQQAERGLAHCRDFQLWPDWRGRPQWRARFYALPGACLPGSPD